MTCSLKNFARVVERFSHKNFDAATVLAATADIMTAEKKKETIVNIANAMNSYFKSHNMRERYLLLANYLRQPTVESHKNAVRILVNILNGLLDEAALYFVVRYDIFENTMTETPLHKNGDADEYSLSGCIFRSKYMDSWYVKTVYRNNPVTKQTEAFIELSAGMDSSRARPYVFRADFINEDGTLGHETPEDLYKLLFNFMVKEVNKNLLISDKDIHESGMVF